VGTDREIAVVFSEPMDPASINSSSFTIEGMTGTVSYDATNKIGAFKPSLTSPQYVYNAIIGVGAKDMSGTPLAVPYNFSFTTRATSDTSAPFVIAVNLVAGATCVPQNQKILATFDEQMDSLTINPSTFLIVGVTATVTYDVVTQIATLTPSSNLAANTTYTIMVTAGAKDMGGVPVAPLQQTFTTGPCQAVGTPRVARPNIGNFSVLAEPCHQHRFHPVSGMLSMSRYGRHWISAGAGRRDDSSCGVASGAGHVDCRLYRCRTIGRHPRRRRGSATLTSGVCHIDVLASNSGDHSMRKATEAVFIFQISSTPATGVKPALFWPTVPRLEMSLAGRQSATWERTLCLRNHHGPSHQSIVTTGVNLEGRALARNGAVTFDTDVITGCTCP
jgi:hypothetical protein